MQSITQPPSPPTTTIITTKMGRTHTTTIYQYRCCMCSLLFSRVLLFSLSLYTLAFAVLSNYIIVIMGISISSDESVNKDFKQLLKNSGFIDRNYLPLGDFANAIKCDLRWLIESVVQRKNAKGAMSGSTNANIRSLQFVLHFWKSTYPGLPIPRNIKKQLQRLLWLNCYCLFVS